MKLAQVTFIAKRPTWVSVKPKRYLINTSDKSEALSMGEELLNKEEHADRYKALPVLLLEVHDVSTN